MKLRLEFPFTDLSQNFVIYIGLCTQVFYSSAWGLRGDLKSFICIVKSKVINIQPQSKYKTRNFQNLIRKRFLRDIH